jgi:DNA-directed RNA polymerase specialized sigma24 family protein
MLGYRLREALNRCERFFKCIDRSITVLTMTGDNTKAHQNAVTASGADRETYVNAVSLNGEVNVPERSEVNRKIVAALEQLPLYERAALFLRDVERLPLSAVADQLGCSIPEARLHIAKGRVKLLGCREAPHFNADRLPPTAMARAERRPA